MILPKSNIMTDFKSKVEARVQEIAGRLEDNVDYNDAKLTTLQNAKDNEFIRHLNIDFSAGALVYISLAQLSQGKNISFLEYDIFSGNSTQDVETNITDEQLTQINTNIDYFEKIVVQLEQLGENTRFARKLMKSIRGENVQSSYDHQVNVRLSLIRYIKLILLI